MRPWLALLILLYVNNLCLFAQAQQTGDSATVRQIPARYYEQAANQAQSVDQALTQKTTQYLNKLSRLEAKILAKLHGSDSTKSASLPPANYSQLASQMSTPGTGATTVNYVPSLDTLQTTLKFLQVQGGPASTALSQVQQLQGSLNTSNLVQQYISERRQELANLLGSYTHLPPGVTQELTQYKETAYYYSQQVQQYKAMLNDPDKMEKLAVNILSRSAAYSQFLAKNSILASLFQLPAAYGSSASTQGLQTQSQIQQLMQQSGSLTGGVGGGPTAAVQQQIQGAQSQLTGIQNSISQYGAGGNNLDMPNFKPNSQKTKTFLKRLEYGVNVQFAKSAYDFPATGNLGLSLGYKINDKSTIGVGTSYNMGLGTSWSFIQFTSQGVGLRSFMDWKIKKTYYVTGGYELNYMSQFSSITELQNRSAWQPSALIGLEKKYKISSKLQGNLQLLFDALYRQEIPAGQAIKFRVGYNF